MRINKLVLFLFLSSLSIVNELFATHIVGGTLEYVRLGPGSLPNSSRYKVKLKIYRNDSAGSVGLNPRAIIYVRGDARFPTVPIIAPDTALLNARYSDSRIFVRDFVITRGSFLDTLTVRNGAMTDQPITNNNFYVTSGWGSEFNYRRLPYTTITGVSTTPGFPGYEYSAFTATGMTYPAAQFMADRSPGVSGYGFLNTYKVVDNSKLVDTCTSVVQNSIEIYEFTRVVDLPNIPGGLHMYFEISARNNNIRNIRNPGGTGFTLYTRIPDYAALDPDPDSYTKLYQAYSALPGVSTLPGAGTILGLGNAFTFAGLNAGFGTNGGYLNDLIRNNSLTGIVKTMQNSSPRFVNRPPSFICNTTQNLINLGKNQNKSGDHFSAFDYDGDELLYEIVSASTVQSNGTNNDVPWTGRWRSNAPSPTTINGVVFSNATSPATLLYPTMPYTNLAYPINVDIATFKHVNYTTFAGSGLINSQFPLGLIGTTPGLIIDPQTGYTQFNPPVSARMVTSIRVREFRNVYTVGGVLLGKAFLGQINTDYQFVVRSCPLPSLAYMASTIGCFKPLSSAVPLQFAPLDASKDATSSWFWDTGRDRYTITGINPTIPGSGNLQRVSPSGTIVTNSTIGGVSSPAFYRTGRNTTYSFPGVGSYFVKLVVQLNSNGIDRTTCSDSAYTVVHVSELRSGFTVTGGPICVGTPISFNPFATGLAGSVPGFVTTSGASLYTSILTNPIPKVVRYEINSTTGAVLTYLGNANWMQADGSRSTVEPDPSLIAPSKILYVKYAFGDGVIQEFTRSMASNTWTAQPAVGIAGAKVTITGLNGTQSIPGVSYSYSSASTNIRPYLLVRNQFGCQDSVFRNVTVVSALPTARIITQSVCQNVTTVTVEGFLTTASRGIWSGNQGSFFPAGGATVTGVSTILGSGLSTVQGFYLRSTYIPSLVELSTAPGIIPLVLSTTGVTECPVGASTVAGIPVTPRPFVDAGPPRVLLCRNNLQYALNATISGASTTGLWTARSSDGKFTSTDTNVSTSLGDNFIFDNAAITNVVLTLTATNIGSCNPVRDIITLTADALKPLPIINAANLFTVNGIQNGLSVCANSPVFTILGTVTNAGIGGAWTSLSTSPGTSFSPTVTSLTGFESFIVPFVYTPSSADIANGYVDLRISTAVTPDRTSCSNVTRDVRVQITEAPRLDLSISSFRLNQFCINNPLNTITGTVTGSGGFSLNVLSSTGILSSISTITGTVLGANGVSRNYFINNFTYIPSAQENAYGKLSRAFPQYTITGVSSNNGNCLPASRNLNFNIFPEPRAEIMNNGVIVDSISLCKNNASLALFNVTLIGIPPFNPDDKLVWISLGAGSFNPIFPRLTARYDARPDTSSGSVKLVLESGNPDVGCLPTYDTVKINFYNPPIISPGSDIYVCDNFLLGSITGTVSLPASGGIWSTNSNAGYFGSNTSSQSTSALSTVYNPRGIDIVNGSAILTLSSTGINIGTASGKCLQESKSINVIITPRPIIQFGPIPTVNQNNSVFTLNATVASQLGFSNVTSQTTGTWYTSLNSNPSSFVPSPNNFTYVFNGGNSLLSGSVTYTPTATEISNGVVNMNVSVAGANNCAPIVASTIIGIFPRPTATIFNKGQSVCANNNVITLTGSITGANGAIWSGGDNAILSPTFNTTTGIARASYIPSSSEINQGYVVLYLTSTLELNNANSVRDVTTVTITAPPTAQIGLSSLSVCGNSLFATFPASISGSGGFVWTTTGTGQFRNVGGGAITFPVVSTSNAIVEYYPSNADKVTTGPIKLTLTSSTPGCVSAFDIANLYFTPSPVANAGPNSTYCLNTPTPIPLNASGTIGSWRSSVAGRFSSTGTSTSTSFSDSFSPTLSIPGVISFTWITGGSCPTVSGTTLVTVLSAPIINVSQPLDSICGNTSTIDLSSTITGGSGMKWRASASGGYFTSSSPANSQIGQDINSTIGTDTYVFSAADKLANTINLTVTSIGTSPCNAVSSLKTINISPVITGNAGADLELCSTQNVISLSGIVLANGVADNNRGGVWTIVGGSAFGSFSNPSSRNTVVTVTSLAINPPNRQVRLVFLPTLAGTCFAPQPSDTVTYTFRQAPSLGITGSPFQVCSDTSFITLNATFLGAAGIVWSTSGTNTSSNWVSSNISTITGNTTVTSSNTVNYFPTTSDLNRPTLSFSVTANGSGVCANSTSSSFTVTVNSKPVVSVVAPSSVCENQSLISLSGTNMTVTGIPRPQILWYKFNGGVATSVGFNLPTTITTNNVGTVTTYAPTSSDKSIGFVTLFLSITGPNTCKPQTFSKVISFSPAPTVAIGAPTINLCSNVPVITLTGSLTNSTLASWSLTSPVSSGSFTGINSLTAVFVPSAIGRTLTALGFRFTTSLAGCNDVFSDKTVLVTPSPVVTIPGSFGSFCGDNAVVTLSGGFSSTNSASLSTNFGGVFGPNNQSYQPIIFQPSISSVVNSYTNGTAITITLTSTNNGVCSPVSTITSFNFTPPPTISGGADLLLCANTTNVILSTLTGVSASPSIVSFGWSTSANSTLAGGAGIFTFSGLSTSTGLSQVYRPGSVEKTGSTTLTIYTTSVAGGCKNISAQKVITYDVAPTFASLPNLTRCSNNAIISINAVATNYSSIKWSSSSKNLTGGGVFIDENIISTQYSPGTLDVSNRAVTITGTVLGLNTCSTSPIIQSFVLSLTSPPILTLVSPLNVCSDVSTVQLSAISNYTNTGFTWTNLTSSISGTYSLNEFISNPVYSLSSDDIARQGATLQVTANYGSCAPVTDIVALYIVPKPIINAGNDYLLCADVTKDKIRLTFTGQNFTQGKWSGGQGNYGSPAIDQGYVYPGSLGSLGYVDYFPSVQDSLLGSINFRVTSLDHSGLCAAVNDFLTVTLVSPPVINAGTSADYCATIGVITLSGSISGPETYLYQWLGIAGNNGTGSFTGTNASAGTIKTITGSGLASDQYTLGVGYEDAFRFGLNVTGTGVCTIKTGPSHFVNYGLQQPSIATFVGGDFSVCADATELTLTGFVAYSTALGQSLSPFFTATTNSGLLASSDQFKPSQVPPYFYSTVDQGFYSTLKYRLFPSDLTGTLPGVNVTMDIKNSTICPATPAKTSISIVNAPVVSVSGPSVGCSNVSVITVVGYSSTGAGTWSSTTSNATRGIFINQLTVTSGLNTSILGVYSISGDEFTNKVVNLLFRSDANGLCNQVSVPLSVPLKLKPQVDAGVDGTICSSSILTLTGSITEPVTASGSSFAWTLVGGTASGSLGSITSSSIVNDTNLGTNLQLVSRSFTPSSSSGTLIFQLSASVTGCNSEFDLVTYSVLGLTSLNAGSFAKDTICGSDPLKMNPSPTSEKGVWSTTGTGYFASGGPGVKTSTIMNDTYIPGPGEYGQVVFILSTIPGSLNSCLNKTPSTVTAFLTNGISANSGSSQFISICYNYNPVMAGTVIGTNTARWRSTGTGYFESTIFPGPTSNLTVATSSTLTGIVTISGTNVTTTGYAFNDVYVPSEADKLSTSVIVYLDSQNDGNTKCNVFSSDSLTIYFTKPPTAEAGNDKSICSTDALVNGITISGLVNFPSPNSKLPGQLPTNSARWEVLTLTGSPLSTLPGYFASSIAKNDANATLSGLGQFTTLSISGKDLKMLADDVYFPSISDTINSPNPGYRTLILALRAENVTIAGVNTVTSSQIPILCNPIISTKEITFIPPAYAKVTNFTTTGICNDLSSINIKGQYVRAAGITWTTTGDGSISRNNSDNTDITYNLSSTDLNAGAPRTLLFTPIPVGAANACISPIASVVTVTVNPRPVMTILGSGQTICADNQAVTFNGISLNTFTGSWPSSYLWSTNGSGTVLGASSGLVSTSASGLNIPLVYRISSSDASAENIGFLFSTSGPNTCLPRVINNISLNINPVPVLTPGLNISRCRDNTQIPISLQTIQNVSTVQWVVSRRDIGSATFTVLGTSLASGTLTGGVLASSSNGTLIGDNINAKSIVYSTTASDRSSGAELMFTAYSLINDPNTSLPACNQVSASVSVLLTDTPVVTITSSLSAGGICSDAVSVDLNGSISGLTNLRGVWTTNAFGTFTPTNSVSDIDLATNTYQYILNDLDRNSTLLGLTLSVTGVGNCVNAYSSSTNIVITPAPDVKAGANNIVCGDTKSIPLIGAIESNTNGLFKWITYGTGSFTGISTTDPSQYNYIPSKQDSALGSVTVALLVPSIVSCSPDTSFKTISFNAPPLVQAINSGVSIQSLCSDNTVPFFAVVDSKAVNPKWTAIKPTVAGQQFSNNVRGQFYNSNGDTSTVSLIGSYKPSAEDTLGANRNFISQNVILRLSANGTGACSSQTYTSDINVLFTPRPSISIAPLDDICRNDLRPISLTGYFLNSIAGAGKWYSSGNNSFTKFSNLLSPNPPTVAGTIYSIDKSDIAKGILIFEFRLDRLDSSSVGACKSAINEGSSKNVVAIRFTPAPSLTPTDFNPYCSNITSISIPGISVNTVVSTVQWKTEGTGVFSNGSSLSSITGLVGSGLNTKTRGQVYLPSNLDKSQGQVKLMIYSVDLTNNRCLPDTTSITLKFEEAPEVKVATDGSSVCAGQVITLSGAITGHKNGIWKTIKNDTTSTGYAGNGVISPSSTTLGTVLYSMSTQDANQSILKFALTSIQDNACAPTADTATINLFARPTANAGSPSICTISGIQLAGNATNFSQTVWTTSGSGIFSPSVFASNATYIPSTSDITSGSVTLKFTAKGQGPCDETSSEVTLKLKANPLPSVNAGPDQVVCNGSQYVLNTQLVPGNSYQWFEVTSSGSNTGLISLADKNVLSVPVTVSGFYTNFVLRVVDESLGCINTDTVRVKSTTLPGLDLLSKVCYDDNLILSVGSSFNKIGEGVFQWYRRSINVANGNEVFLDGETSSSISVNAYRNEPVTYLLEFKENGTNCVAEDSTRVRPLPYLERVLGRVVCQGDVFSMSPNVLSISGISSRIYGYRWDLTNYNSVTGINTLIGETFTAGTDTLKTITGVTLLRSYSKYLVSVIDRTDTLGCTSSDTIRVKTHPKPEIPLLASYQACGNEVITLNATPLTLVSPIVIKYPPTLDSTSYVGSFNWRYSNGSIETIWGDTSQNRLPLIRITNVNSSTGIYSVRFTIGECTATKSTTVTFDSLSEINNESEVPYCIDDRERGIGKILVAGSNPTLKYLWLASGNENPQETVYDTTKYYVRISNGNGCSYLDSIKVRPSCNPRVYFPEGLIPDSPDPRNRYFTVFGKYFANPELTIFNRWGEIVFYSKDIDFIMNNGWDGTFGETKLPTGVYPYIFKYDGLYPEQKGKRFEERKSVTIIR